MEDSVSLCPVIQCVGFGDEPVFVALPMITFAVYFSEILGGFRYRVPVLPRWLRRTPPTHTIRPVL